MTSRSLDVRWSHRRCCAFIPTWLDKFLTADALTMFGKSLPLSHSINLRFLCGIRAWAQSAEPQHSTYNGTFNFFEIWYLCNWSILIVRVRGSLSSDSLHTLSWDPWHALPDNWPWLNWAHRMHIYLSLRRKAIVSTLISSSIRIMMNI